MFTRLATAVQRSFPLCLVFSDLPYEASVVSMNKVNLGGRSTVANLINIFTIVNYDSRVVI